MAEVKIKPPRSVGKRTLKMSTKQPRVITHNPQLRYCYYCNTHITTAHYDDRKQMCDDCIAREQLELEARHGLPQE